MKKAVKKLAKSTRRLYRKQLLPVAMRLKIGVLRLFGRELNAVYDEEFATQPWRNKPYADAFCEAILKEFPASSVVDIGCGTGDFLRAFHERGLVVLGVDGSQANFRNCMIPRELFLMHDIRRPITLPERYDLCLCLEVAEHLPKKNADGLVDLLTGVSDTLVFTAAPPGQGGVDHLNEQPATWWIEKFERRGFSLLSRETANVKTALQAITVDDEDHARGLNIYIENLMAFARRSR